MGKYRAEVINMKEEFNMDSQQYEHATDEVVEETGAYTCEAGITKRLNKGDKFPSCPESEVVTYWKHAEGHHHNSGEPVTEAGRYIDEDGDELDLAEGSTFPNCPKADTPTQWRHAGN